MSLISAHHCICIHFYLRFNIFLFIFIGFDFDTSRITIQPRIMICLKIKNQVESKIKGRWIVIHWLPNHWLIRFRIKSESKLIANQAGPSPALVFFTKFSRIQEYSNNKNQTCYNQTIMSRGSGRIPKLLLKRESRWELTLEPKWN